MQRKVNMKDFAKTTNSGRTWIWLLPIIAVSGAVCLLMLAVKAHNKNSALRHSIAAPKLRQFAVEKEAQASAAADADGQKMLPEYRALFAAAKEGDWQQVQRVFKGLSGRASQYRGAGKGDARLHGTQWEAIKETWGAMEAFAVGDEKYSGAYGKDIIDSITPGSIYFGGTDPGRWIVTAMCGSHVNADPFFTLTQNALADGSYLAYLRTMYGEKISIPSEEESKQCFDGYLADARRREQEHKLKPGEDVRVVDGKVQVSGQVAVMEINGLLARLIFDKNPGREFYVEESFPLEWMYPYLEPHGLILKLNRQPLSSLSEEVVQKDHDYWTAYLKPILGDWLNGDTPVRQVAEFGETVHGKHHFAGFKGDPRFVQNDYARKSFSKLRSSIGGLYAWRLNHASGSEEKERMSREADFAFRQAWALSADSPEAVFRYANLLVTQKRFNEAVAVAETAAGMPSMQGKDGAQVRSLAAQLKKFAK